jgi:predicted Zn-dependent peptidase
MGKRKIILLIISIFLVTLTFTFSQNLAEFEKKVTEFTLKNGMKFIIVEKHEAPVISFITYADVGAVNEVRGITGIAHIFEHMAFKGTKTIGTKNYEEEKKILDKMDEIFLQIKKEKRKKQKNPEKLKALQEEFKKLREKAKTYVISNEFGKIVEEQGGVGLNAFTSADGTAYIYNLPSNKLELWMSLESDRFLNPVLREFYKEKEVIMEERRMRVESQAIGKLFEEFLAIAYKAHPYGDNVVGHMSDLETITRKEAIAFFKKYYIPSNLTVGIVGDVNPKEVKKLAKIYFERIPSGPKPEPVETIEPPQLGERRVEVEDPSQPILLIGYHKPDINHPDNAVYNVLMDILGLGRTSRLYKSLVKEKKIAVQVGAFPGLPGNKYPNLFVLYAIPAVGHTNQECEKAIYEEIEKLKKEKVSEEELEKAKIRARANLVRQLSSNFGLAYQMVYYEVLTGDWRNLFKSIEAIKKVTADDIMRVAKECFKKTNRIVGQIVTVSSEK